MEFSPGDTMCIVILGMHRSGTSAVAQLVCEGGASFGDHLISGADDNVQGFFEDKRLVEINEQCLGHHGMSWDVVSFRSLDFLPDHFAAQRLVSELSNRSPVWAIKDPRLCLTLPLWLPLIDQVASAQFVLVIRHPLAVARSLLKRNEFSLVHGVCLWVVYVARVLESLASRAMLVIDYDEMIRDPNSVSTLFRQQFGLDLQSNTAIDSGFRHNTAEKHDGLMEHPCYKLAVELYECLSGCHGKPPVDTSALVGKAKKMLAAMDAYQSEIRKYREQFQIQDKFITHQQLDIARIEQLLIARLHDVEELRTCFQDGKATIKLLSDRRDEISNDLMAANNELWRLKQHNVALQNTLSWRLTKPLRRLRPLVAGSSLWATVRHSSFGRAIYTLNLLQTNLWDLFSKSKGNGRALTRMVELRRRHLFSRQHIQHVERVNDLDWPILDVSIVTYNNGKCLPEFFASLKSQNYPLIKINLQVVDNSSCDDTCEILFRELDLIKPLLHSVNFIKSANVGFGLGHNQAIQCGSASFFLVTNVDVMFLPNTLTNLVSAAVNDDSDVACWEARQAPFEHPKFVDPVTLEVNWCSHCCVLIRRTAYDQVGGYEPNIFMYGEDVELSYRFRSYGWRLRYVPRAKIIHNTYKEENEVKPLQLIGSVFANGLVRIRYGDWYDVIGALVLQTLILFRPQPIPGAKFALVKNALRILKMLPNEIANGGRKRGELPFRGFDYDMRRDGAFYRIPLDEPTDDDPLISVVTRTYQGREHWLRECIASVMNQTYSALEHIIVEDGGDSHSAFIANLRTQYPSRNIRYFPISKAGRSAAGNYGLAEAKGRYIIFLDDDDLFLPDHIEILYKSIACNANSAVKAAYSLAWEVRTDVGDHGNYSEYMYLTDNVFKQHFSREILFHHNFIPIQAILFDREFFDVCGGFDESLEQLEDWNLWVKYSLRADFVWVDKTSSVFRTPHASLVALKRKALLDQAYQDVCRKNKLLIEATQWNDRACENV